jgi:hypothetical protein
MKRPSLKLEVHYVPAAEPVEINLPRLQAVLLEIKALKKQRPELFQPSPFPARLSPTGPVKPGPSYALPEQQNKPASKG